MGFKLPATFCSQRTNVTRIRGLAKGVRKSPAVSNKFALKMLTLHVMKTRSVGPRLSSFLCRGWITYRSCNDCLLLKHVFSRNPHCHAGILVDADRRTNCAHSGTHDRPKLINSGVSWCDLLVSLVKLWTILGTRIMNRNVCRFKTRLASCTGFREPVVVGKVCPGRVLETLDVPSGLIGIWIARLKSCCPKFRGNAVKCVHKRHTVCPRYVRPYFRV